MNIKENPSIHNQIETVNKKIGEIRNSISKRSSDLENMKRLAFGALEKLKSELSLQKSLLSEIEVLLSQNAKEN